MPSYLCARHLLTAVFATDAQVAVGLHMGLHLPCSSDASSGTLCLWVVCRGCCTFAHEVIPTCLAAMSNDPRNLRRLPCSYRTGHRNSLAPINPAYCIICLHRSLQAACVTRVAYPPTSSSGACH